MAEITLTNAYVELNSVDLSDKVRRVTINYEAEMVSKDAMSNDARRRIAGLKNWTAELEFNQDYASGEVDATLFSLVGAAAFAVEFRPDAGSVSATNPKYTGNALLASYTPISGSVGELNMANVTLEGDDDLTRATS